MIVMEILLERIKDLCKSRSITVTNLEGILDLPTNTIYQWKKRVPNTERLQKVADYFGVSIDYLLGRTDDPETKRYYDLTDKEKADIAIQADSLLEGIESGTDVNFYGEPATEEQKERLRVAIRTAMEMNKEEAKKKFTPKKYRD